MGPKLCSHPLLLNLALGRSIVMVASQGTSKVLGRMTDIITTYLRLNPGGPASETT